MLKKWLPKTFAISLTALVCLILVTMYALLRENRALHTHLGIDPSMGDLFAREADRWATLVSNLISWGICIAIVTLISGGLWYLSVNWEGKDPGNPR